MLIAEGDLISNGLTTSERIQASCTLDILCSKLVKVGKLQGA
jgi:hypothetical protein